MTYTALYNQSSISSITPDEKLSLWIGITMESRTFAMLSVAVTETIPYLVERSSSAIQPGGVKSQMFTTPRPKHDSAVTNFLPLCAVLVRFSH